MGQGRIPQAAPHYQKALDCAIACGDDGEVRRCRKLQEQYNQKLKAFKMKAHATLVKGNNFATLAGIEAGNDNFDKAVKLYTSARECYSEIFDDEKIAIMDQCLQDVEEARQEHMREQQERALLAQRQACEQALASADLLLASAQECAADNRYDAALDHGESAVSGLQSVRTTAGYENACDAKIGTLEGLCKTWRERQALQDTARATVNDAMTDAQASYVAQEYQKAIDCLESIGHTVAQVHDDKLRSQYETFRKQMKQLNDVEKSQKDDNNPAVNEARMIRGRGLASISLHKYAEAVSDLK